MRELFSVNNTRLGYLVWFISTQSNQTSPYHEKSPFLKGCMASWASDLLLKSKNKNTSFAPLLTLGPVEKNKVNWKKGITTVNKRWSTWPRSHTSHPALTVQTFPFWHLTFGRWDPEEAHLIFTKEVKKISQDTFVFAHKDDEHKYTYVSRHIAINFLRDSYVLN